MRPYLHRCLHRYLQIVPALLLAIFSGFASGVVDTKLASSMFASTASSVPSGMAPIMAPMIVSYTNPIGHSVLHTYKVDLIRTILEQTRAEFGDYRIKPLAGENPNDLRRVALLNEGKLVNLLWGSPGTLIANAEAIPIPVDILNGLLGYRICFTHSDVPLKLENLKDLEALRALKFGQGAEWPDVKIYQQNQLTLVPAPSFGSLFDMLGYKRFECLALGANEIMETYHQKKAQYPFLTIDNSLLIYYDFPIYFYVSKKHPELAKRLQLGLEKLQKSGEFTQLFKQHHDKDLALLNLRQRKVFCLKSPYVNDANQCAKPLKYPD
jgi:hypothetical protein